MAASNLILSYPSLLTTLSLGSSDANAQPKSWIQLARTGSFVSNRYGKFSITKDDLSQMLRNFREITPKSPTELPIDYDHLSMDPKKPGDGIAAGWMKNLELRKDGAELWAEVEWTPDGAERVRNKEYRFISPSFVKDHTHKDGKKIGTTLLAAAVTNHPFLEGMKAVTLCNASVMGNLAMEGGRKSAVLSLDTDSMGTKVGQRVMIAPAHARTQDELGATFEIVEVVGDADPFVSIKDASGKIHKWFRADELLPASITPANPVLPALQPGNPQIPQQLPQPVTPALQEAQSALQQQAVPGAPPPMGAPAAAGPAMGQDPSKTAEESAEGEDPAAEASETPAEESVEDGPQDPAATKAKTPAATLPFMKAKAKEPAAAAPASATPAATDKKTGKTDEEDDPVMGALKKALATLSFSDGPISSNAKGDVMTFKLHNDKGDFEVTSEQLAAAGIKVVPEGSTVIATTELDGLRGQVTNLSSRLDESDKRNAQAEMDREISRLLEGGFILGSHKEYAQKVFAGQTDLSNFKAWAATFTTKLVPVGQSEHGTSAGATTGDDNEAGTKLLSLAQRISKEEGISLSVALGRASAQDPKAAEQYREGFAHTA